MVAVTVDRAGGDGVVGHDVLVSLASRRADRSTDKLVDARSPSVSNLYCQRLGEPGVFQGYRAEALSAANSSTKMMMLSTGRIIRA